jgi:anaerobic magnesium-protoporphyrin IX monomethyl ester cyclase
MSYIAVMSKTTNPPADSDSTLALLAEVSACPPWTSPPADGPRVLFISLYCFKSFPVRGFHQLARQSGIDSHAVFFKDNLTNRHTPITEDEIGYLKALLRRVNPDMVAISVLAPYVPAARRVIAAVREVTDVPVVAGGKHPTISSDEALGYADYVCKGEGELVVLDIFERLRAGSRDFSGIKGLWHRDAAGKPVDMGQRMLIQDLDLIPFEAYGEPQMHFIEYGRHVEHDPEMEAEEILVMAGRGCVYMCSYCVNSLLIPMNRGNGRFVRLRSPANVIAQVMDRAARQPKARFASFNDEVFGVFDDWTREFSEAYRKAGGPPFNCELVPKLIKEKNVRALVEAGLYEMHFGIQSGSDEIRSDVLKRPGKNVELLEKAQMLAECGVQVQCDLILGNPFDTAEAIEESIRLLTAMPQPLKLNTYKLQFFPHYPLTLRALAAGHITEADLHEDKVAGNTLYNFIYRPVVTRFDRKTVLENCIYLIPWNTPLVWWLAKRLCEHSNPILGAVVNGLAAWRYQLDFCANPALVWLRRLWLVGRMVAMGDLGGLRRRLTARLLRST